MNTVEIEIRAVYGRENIYPVNNQAKLFAEIAGQKTLSRAQLKAITELGFKIAVVQPEFTF